MATKKSQRIGVWVIAIAMIVGTMGGFAAMIVAPGNEAKEQALLEQAQREWDESKAAQATELGAKYYPVFSEYQSRIGEFSADGIDELGTEDLLAGDGDVIADDTNVSMYYVGWNPSGQIFDGSIEGDSLKEPFPVDGPATTSVIEGWQKGLVGMKIGGVRELTIPSDMAYGEVGSGEAIPPNTPLKFIVMAIPRVEDVPAPKAIKDFYKRSYGIDI